MKITIRKAKLTDLRAWSSLWQDYLAFYDNENLADDITELLWQRIHTQGHPIECFLAEDVQSKKIIAFSHYFAHSNTWQKHDICYIEDIFIDAQYRNQGLGKVLIEAVQNEAISKGWQNVHWYTKHDNTQARNLYDKLTGGTNGFVSYRLPTK